ncbi:carbonic anhydrase family protein [Oxalobacteraceae bacterium R-40]|uniref:Carbonic anhydrase family protein n=1 Tax=Keguizhuia sedimenti TaxID=3064264 RepID=A0ABU1BL50_9BURK|nr:carbonic anhydrase family protein [Oxalobacteraceae bacterium R-40]
MNKLYTASVGKLSVLALALALSACAQQPVKQAAAPAAAQSASAPLIMTKERQQKITADQALQMLKEGNARFVSDQTHDRDHPAHVKTTGKGGQYPLASIVNCIDSRTPPSLVFDKGIGDLFVASVAGNIINPDILGSLEYASKVAGTKLIVVLGHTHCGAVKGACDNVALGNLTQLLAKIRPAVDATPNTHGSDRSSKNHHFVDAVAHNNVHLTVKDIMDKSAVLREMAQKGEIKIVGAMLDVETGKVHFE